MWFLKTYALFHDPPHKALWFEHEGYRIFNKDSHEEEGVNLMTSALPGLGGAPSKEDREAVALADRLAASFDRWALPPSPGGYWAKAKYLINPFNYEKKIEVKKPPPDDFRQRFHKFVNDLKKAVEPGGGDEKRLYLYTYAAYELAWINAGLPALPADTRAPTHTAFDHLYATASVLNWVRGGRLRGCLAVADIPGIQSVLKSARKAGDYRAGSILISLAAWGLAWRYAERHGPDVLLSPTPRFNPLFYAQLRRENQALWDLYKRVVGKMLERELGPAAAAFVETVLKTSSLFPGTVYLALPECDEGEAETYFQQSLCDLLEAAKGAEAEAIPLTLSPLGDDVKKIVAKALEGIKPDYLPLKWAYVTVDEALDGLDKWAEETYGAAAEPERFLFARLMYMLNERKREKLPKAPKWFETDGTPRFQKLYDGTWVHSSLDPSQPAVLKFGGAFRGGQLDYDDETHALLAQLGVKNTEALKKVFKPKEALGPVDVIKRALYLRASGGMGVESVEAVALRPYVDKCPQLRGKIERVLQGEDVEAVFGGLEAAEKELAECGASLIYAVVRADGDNVGKLLSGCLPTKPQTPQLEVVGDAEQYRKDLEKAQRLIDSVQKAAAQMCQGGHYAVPSPSYYAAASASLMLTALMDAAAVFKHSGELVFSGGDDLLALVPKEAAFDAVEATRRSYHGQDGFHPLTDTYHLPAPAAYGRSYSLRLAHAVTDYMSVEVDKAAELLEHAKEATAPEKDALAISTSTGHAGYTKVAKTRHAKAVAEAYKTGALSRNLPYDLEAWGPSTKYQFVLRYLTQRNTKTAEAAEAVLQLAGEEWQNTIKLLKALREWT